MYIDLECFLIYYYTHVPKKHKLNIYLKLVSFIIFRSQIVKTL